MAIIDHIGLEFSDYPAGPAFLSAGARAARYLRCHACNEGGDRQLRRGRPWTGRQAIVLDRRRPANAPRVHVAFVAETRAAVDRFFEAALAAGGVDNGAPGIRAHYHPNYYGAFVLDPEGHNIEAVCHASE